jgi:hypothetical protein
VSLQEWSDRGWIEPHKTSAAEIGELLRIVERDISQSETPGLLPDWRLNIAYNAALQCATAALMAVGFRPRDQLLRHRILAAQHGSSCGAHYPARRLPETP